MQIIVVQSGLYKTAGHPDRGIVKPSQTYPDRFHSEIKSKHENFNSKNPPDPLL
jgi:hypothetical protein